MKIAIVGTYPPRKCGIATFTHDLYRSIQQYSLHTCGIIALTDNSENWFEAEVEYVIKKENFDSYSAAANYINNNYDCCIIQHEFGIFGGQNGKYVLNLTHKLSIPLVSNFHTIPTNPSANEKHILCNLAKDSQSITVMTSAAIGMLENIYRIPTSKIVNIPHGVPTFDYDQDLAKEKLGLMDKKIMLTFGFLGRNKGIETAIESLVHVADEHVLYLILGTTHPNILKEEGEAYRNSLLKKTKELGISHKVKFVNKFVTEDMLIQYLSACDIYVTPYPHENQISSGTLSFAVGAGAAVLSTPYVHARDLLADERGLLFGFRDVAMLGSLINLLVTNPSLLQKYRSNAAAYGRKISWKNISKLHIELLQKLSDWHNATTSSHISTHHFCIDREIDTQQGLLSQS